MLSFDLVPAKGLKPVGQKQDTNSMVISFWLFLAIFIVVKYSHHRTMIVIEPAINGFQLKLGFIDRM
jgi:hypothetical protein